MSKIKIKEQPVGSFGIIMKTGEEEISQIGLTQSQYNLLEIFLAQLSPLIKLPGKYSLQPVRKPFAVHSFEITKKEQIDEIREMLNKSTCKHCDRGFDDCIC